MTQEIKLGNWSSTMRRMKPKVRNVTFKYLVSFAEIERCQLVYIDLFIWLGPISG